MKIYDGNAKKVIATGMSIMMIGSLAACGSSSEESAALDKDGVYAKDEEEMTEVLTKSLGLGSATDADKEETVYLISDANGDVKDTIVDEWLKNPEKKDVINDVSRLSDIENVKGDEAFEQDGTKLTWQASGSDIYYEGHTTEKSPVSVKATYYLNDKEVGPDEIAGQTGHVRIKYEYINDAKTGDVYAPFVMATSMILGMDNFANVTATNAKVISDGSRYIVVGYGMPGLGESLDLDDKDIEIPDYFEVEADATDFELGMTITVASVETLGDEDIDTSDIEKEINDLADEYQTGMNSLVDGISQYTNGVDQVAGGVNTLSSGADTLYNGAGTLSSGIESAADGADSIKNGLDSAYSGSKQVSDGAAELNAAVQAIELPDVTKMGSGEVDDATKAAIKEQAEATLGTDTASYVGGAISNAVSGAVGGTLSQVVAYQTGGEGAVASAAQTAAVAQAGTAQTKAADAATNYAGTAQTTAGAIVHSIYGDTFNPEDPTQQQYIYQITQAIAAAYGEGYGTSYCEGYGAGYGAEYAEYLSEFGAYNNAMNSAFQSEDFTGVVTNVANAYASAGSKVTLGKVNDAMGAFSTKLDTLKAGTQSLADGSSSLTTGLETLDTGAGTLQSGMGQLKTGAGTLYNGTKTLKDGVGELKSGTDKLSANSDALNDGAGKLQTATDTLVDKLNETEDGVNDFVDNVNAVRAAGENYQSFGGASDKVTSSTKFIIKVDGIDGSKVN